MAFKVEHVPLSLLEPHPELQHKFSYHNASDRKRVSNFFDQNWLLELIVVSPLAGDRYRVESGHESFAAIKELEAAGKVMSDYLVSVRILSSDDA